MKYFFLSLGLLALFGVLILGTRGHFFDKPPIEIFPDMDRQLKYKAQKPADFFGDGRVARPPVDGTVPIGYRIPDEPLGVDAPDGGVADPADPYGQYSIGDSYFDTGRIGDYFGDGIPVDVTMATLERGRERYEINCTVCHGPTGLGNGTVSNYWTGAPIASLQEQRILDMPDGQIYHTITHGKGVAPNWTMFPYGDKITVEDRWAIVAYMRAMQRGMNATLDDVPPEMRNQFETAEVGQ